MYLNVSRIDVCHLSSHPNDCRKTDAERDSGRTLGHIRQPADPSTSRRARPKSELHRRLLQTGLLAQDGYDTPQLTRPRDNWSPGSGKEVTARQS